MPKGETMTEVSERELGRLCAIDDCLSIAMGPSAYREPDHVRRWFAEQEANRLFRISILRMLLQQDRVSE